MVALGKCRASARESPAADFLGALIEGACLSATLCPRTERVLNKKGVRETPA